MLTCWHPAVNNEAQASSLAATAGQANLPFFAEACVWFENTEGLPDTWRYLKDGVDCDCWASVSWFPWSLGPEGCSILPLKCSQGWGTSTSRVHGFHHQWPAQNSDSRRVLAESVVFLRFVDLVASTKSKLAKAHVKCPAMSILKAVVFSWAAEVRCCRHGLMLRIDCVGPRDLSVVSGLLVLVHGSCCWRTGS